MKRLRPRRGRLFWRLMQSLGVALCVSFGIAAGVLGLIGANWLRERSGERVRDAAVSSRREMTAYFAQRESEMRLTAQLEFMDDALVDDPSLRIQNQLLHLQRAFPGTYEAIAVLDAKGRVIAATDIGLIDDRIALDSLALGEALDELRVGQRPLRTLGANRRALPIVMSLRSRLTRESGASLVAFLAWPRILDMIERERSSDAGVPTSLALLDAANRPLGGEREAARLATAVRRADARVEDALVYEVPLAARGQQALVPDWRIASVSLTRDAFAILNVFFVTVAAAFGLGLLIAAVLIWRIAHDLARRVRTLTVATARLARGDYTHRIADGTHDDLGRLGRAFDRMAGELQRSRREEAEARASIEATHAELLEAARIRSEFLANTSHELRTPLNGNIGFLQIVLDGLCSTPEEERGFLEKALGCSRRLLGLINDLIDISRIESGRLKVDLGPVSVEAALRTAAARHQQAAVTKGLDLRVDVPPEVAGLSVIADATRLHQVFDVLIDNSLKFTASGHIELRARAIPGSNTLRFEVEDTGIGIPPERLGVIFELFRQGDGGATRRFGGTGLGLSLARRLVEMMGGLIEVKSPGENQGTIATFAMPEWLEPSRAKGGEPAPASAVLGTAGGPLVLVVEDNPTSRDWMLDVLHESGYRTMTADSADRGWRLASRLRPDVVISDFALRAAPAAQLRTGQDLAERILGESCLADAQVLLVTGHDVNERLTAFRPAHQARIRVLGKPVDLGEFVEVVAGAANAARTRRFRLLVVERDPERSARLREALPEPGFLLEMVANPDEGLETLGAAPLAYDALVVDGENFGPGCRELCNALGTRTEFSHVGVFLMTPDVAALLASEGVEPLPALNARMWALPALPAGADALRDALLANHAADVEERRAA